MVYKLCQIMNLKRNIQSIKCKKNMKGGDLCTIPQNITFISRNEKTTGIKRHNLEIRHQILLNLMKKIPCTSDITKKKYFVILYGPPSSGKTVARKIMNQLKI